MERVISQPFLQIDVELESDPDYIAYARALSVGLPAIALPFSASIALRCFYAVVGQFLKRCPTGTPFDLAANEQRVADTLESWAQWIGQPGTFAAAFLDHLCEHDGSQVKIRGFDERYGKVAAKREKDRVRQQEYRDQRRSTDVDDSHIDERDTSQLSRVTRVTNRRNSKRATIAQHPQIESDPKFPASGVKTQADVTLSHVTGVTCHTPVTPFLVKSIDEEVDTPLPPPGGGGSPPIPPPPGDVGIPASLPDSPNASGSTPRAVPEAHASTDTTVLAQGITDPVLLARRAKFAADLDDAVASVPDSAARAAIRRVLEETRVAPARWPNLVARMANWTGGLATTGMRPVSWEALAEGVNELLDTNPEGQPITSQILLTFVEKAERRRNTAPTSAAAPPPPPSGTTLHDGLTKAEVGEARHYASLGDPAWIAFCRERHITFESAAP